MSKFNPNIKVGSPHKGFHLRVEGAGTIIKNLELTKNQKKILKAFLKKEGEKVVAVAKRLVPVKTRRLQKSHRVLKHSGGGDPKHPNTDFGMDVVVGGIIVKKRRVVYAAAVHEGNPKHPIPHLRKGPNPWLAKAIQQTSKGYLQRLAKAVKFGKKAK